jgi:hypothetical protein
MGVAGFGESEGYRLARVASWSQARVDAVRDAWFRHGVNIPSELPRGSGGFVVSEEIKRSARDRATAAVEQYARETKAKPRRPRKTVLTPRPLREIDKQTERRHVYSAFSFAGKDSAERYVTALRELRAARTGFDSRDGYNIKRIDQLTENQRRQIRRAFNALRLLKTQVHQTMSADEIRGKVGKKQFSDFLRQQGQHGDSKKWRQVFVKAPDQTRGGKPTQTHVVELPDGTLAVEQSGVIKKSFRWGVGLAVAAEEGRVEEWVVDFLERKTPGASAWHLNFSGVKSTWIEFRNPYAVAATVAKFFDEGEETYGDPDILEGVTAYWNAEKPVAGVDRTTLLLARERDRRVEVREAKRYWANARREIKNTLVGLLRGLRISLGRMPMTVEEFNAELKNAYNNEYLRLYSLAVDKAEERGIMSEQELYNTK